MKIKLKDVRIAFTETLFTPKEYKEGDGKPRYSATFLIDPKSDNHKAVEAAIIEAAKETHGAKAEAFLKSVRGNSNKFCYQDGDSKDYDGFAGMMYIAAHRRAQDGAPLVVGADKAALKSEDGIIYGGCYVNGVIEIYVQKGENSGVRCALLGVQFVRDGQAFAGSRATTADFDDLADKGEDLFG